MLPRILILFCMTLGAACAEDIHFLIMPDEVVGPISPYVYGLNAQDPTGLNVTVRRLGGNRMTGYNWENNASNAGSDWNQSSDNWLCSQMGVTNCDEPGAVPSRFIEDDQKAGLDSLMTLPMAGYVAADKNGDVAEDEKAPSVRFDKVVFEKKRPFSLVPDLKDHVVYVDEFIHFLVSKFKDASDGGVKFYALDNEPALWPTTHPRIHPKPTGYWEMVDKTERLAWAVLKVDPHAVIFGPVAYGWKSYLDLQDAPDGKDINAQFGTFLDFYLDQMKYLEQRDGKRLLHVLDLHWYPEAQGNGMRITQGDTSPDSVDTRLQAPRSLWDPSYTEKSWIADTWKKPIQLIPWVQQKIDQRYPGTKLAFTEYDYGAGDHISGGLAQADVLGIFGKYGVFMSNYWGDLKAYNKAAFKLYRNYDGKNSTFGNTAVSAGTDDTIQTSIYASTDATRPGTLWMVVLNKNQKNGLHGSFQIQGTETYRSFQAYGFNAQSSDIKPLQKGDVHQDKLDLDLPPLSATLLVLQ